MVWTENVRPGTCQMEKSQVFEKCTVSGLQISVGFSVLFDVWHRQLDAMLTRVSSALCSLSILHLSDPIIISYIWQKLTMINKNQQYLIYNKNQQYLTHIDSILQKSTMSNKNRQYPKSNSSQHQQYLKRFDNIW